MRSLGLAERLGSRWCCAWQVGVTLVLLGLALSAGWTIRLGSGGFAQALAVELAADAAAAAVLAIASVTVFRHRRERSQPIWLVVAVWVVIAAVRGFLMAVWQPEDAARIINSNITLPIWALVVIYLFAMRDEIQGRTRDLEQANAALQSVRTDMQSLLDAERHRLHDAVALGITREIARLRGLVSSLAPSADRAQIEGLADQLSAYSSGVVRTTSHELRAAGPDVVAEAREEGSPAGSSPGILAAYLLASQPVVVPTLLIVTKGFSVAALRWDDATLLAQAVVFGGMCAAIWLGRSLIERTCRRPSLLEGLLSTALLVATALAVVRCFTVTRGSPPDPALVPLSMVGIYIVGVFVAARVLAGARVRWRIINAELETANADLRRANDVLREELAVTQERLADVLHGPVQGRLAAASMALRLYADAVQSGRPADYASTVATTATLLDRAIGDIGRIGNSAEAEWTDVAAGLTSLAAMWTGLVDVTWSDDDPYLRSPEIVGAVVQLASELVTNASRHAHARHVRLVISAQGPRGVAITALDDGCGPPAQVRAGAGFGTVDKYSGSWRVHRTADERTLVELIIHEPEFANGTAALNMD